jgi:hypothetical protein
MLTKEIGRLGSQIENLLPSDLSAVVPNELREGCVGIFWHVGNNRWIIRKAKVLDNSQNCVEMGQEYDENTNPDDLQIDYNFFHKDVWETEIRLDNEEWTNFKYDDFSRGRIVFETLKQKFVIYVPTSMYPAHKAAVLYLAKAFDLSLDGFEVNSNLYKAKKDLDSLNDKALNKEIFFQAV